MSDIRQWLEGVGLERYAEAFEENEVTLDLARDLTDADLKDLGMAILGHRKTLLRAIEVLSAPLAKTETDEAAAPDHSEPRPDDEGAREAERRQITVMFCDLVGSTALSEKLDPEDLRDVMAAYQKTAGAVIERYEGHVAQYLGDGLMTYFGWPRAHEDDAARAIHAALEIIGAIKDVEAPESLRIRVGVATGPVVVGETGAGDASVPKLAVGETPNLAARLQNLAGEDEIVIGETTRRLAAGAFVYDDMGAQALKGIVEPVQAFRVTGTGAAEGRFQAAHGARLTPFVGRVAELALLTEKWEQAKEGEGQLVLLCGEPGIGKSRLAQVLRERAISDGGNTLLYQCSPFHTNTAFHPISEYVARVAGFSAAAAATAKLDKIDAHVRALGLSVDEVAPLIAAALSIPTAERYPSLEMSPQKQKERTVVALADSMIASAAQSPVLFLVEDLHWCDPSSLETATLIVERLRDRRVLALFTFRPEFSPPWSGLDYVTPLTLTRLRRIKVAELIANVTGAKPLPEEVTAEIVAKTDGVPLFVEELTKTVLESSLVEETEDGWRLTGPLSGLAIPATLHDSLMARLDRLGTVKEVAQIGACIGREFGHELLAAVTPLTDEELQDALRELAASELVFLRGAPPDATYTFKHALVQDAAYESLLKSRRSEIHASLVETIEDRFPDTVANEPELLAHHYTKAGLAKKAIGYWLKAGKRASSRSANVEAKAYLREGLELLLSLPESADRDRQEIDLQVALGPPVMAISGYTVPEAGEIYTRALELCRRHGNPPQIFQALYGLSAFHYIRGHYIQARQTSEEFVDDADAQGNLSARVVAHRILGTVLFFAGELVQAQRELEFALELYDDQIHKELRVQYGHDPRNFGLGLLAQDLWILGFPDQALATARDAVVHSETLSDPFNFAWAKIHTAVVHFLRREPDSALALAKAGFDIVTEQKYPYWVSYSKVFIGWARAEQGEVTAGIEEILQGLDYFLANGVQCQIPEFLCALASAYRSVGRDDDASRQISGALGIAERNGEGHSVAELHRLTGDLLCSGNQRDEARAIEEYSRAIEIARTQEAKSWELRAATSLARLWQSQGKRQEAQDLLGPVHDWFTEGFDTADLKEAKALLEELK